MTPGQATRGAQIGVLVLGDRVHVGPNAKLVGAVRVGSNVAIGTPGPNLTM